MPFQTISRTTIYNRKKNKQQYREGTYLYAMVFFIAHVNKSKSVGGDSPGIIKPTVGGPLGAESSEKTTGRIENLNPVVVTIRDDVLADPVHGHSGEAVEFTLAAAVRSELLHEVPIAIEHLQNFNAMYRSLENFPFVLNLSPSRHLRNKFVRPSTLVYSGEIILEMALGASLFTRAKDERIFSRFSSRMWREIVSNELLEHDDWSCRPRRWNCQGQPRGLSAR